jgi:hypothetical protein
MVDRLEFDVAISFAGEDRAAAGQLADAIRARTMSVLLDDYDATQKPGTDILTHIGEIFRTRAWCCLLLFSRHYPLAQWTEAEQTSVQQHALRDAEQYILPVRLADLDKNSMESVAALVEAKLREARRPSGPPSQSHDLRSGNVPSADEL